MENKRVTLFAGHYGSGKTNIAVNYALWLKEKYEKVFYSPDKVKRLIVSKNNIGSYSYHVEKLTILEGEEIYWCGNHAFWEPIFGGGGVSFYENIDDLLKDINAEIKGWIEK